MVTDAVLRSAAAEAQDALLSALAAEQTNLHEFSVAFEKKMEKLTRRAKHPVRYQVLRYAAVIVLMMATLFGSLMAFSLEVRADVIGWFRSTFKGPYAHYDSVDVTDIPDAAAEMEYDYYLPAVPEGYVLWKEMEKIEGKTYMYHKEETGNILFFDYAYSKGIGDAFIGVEGYTYERVKIGQLEGDLYTTTEEGQNNALVWTSKHGGVLFEIFGDISGEELIALAEGVQYQKLPQENET